MPDYLGYVLTGQAVLEKTNASTMQLMNLQTRQLDEDVLNAIDVSKELFPNLVEPGTILGKIQKEKFPTYDLPDATFITIASHDTASAVVGTPGKGRKLGIHQLRYMVINGRGNQRRYRNFGSI